MSAAPVIAICGHPGGGKTTLTLGLKARLGVPALHYDDYETITSQPGDFVRNWIARGSDYDEIDLSRLVDALNRISNAAPRPRCVLLDTLLGRAHGATGRLIDMLIWVDTPSDVALARKIREAAGHALAQADGAPGFAGWLDSYLAHYCDFIAGSYAVQRERVRPGADLILDGRDTPEGLAEQAASAIQRLLQCGAEGRW